MKTVVRGDGYAVTEGEDEPKHTVYVFSTLELRSARWVGEGDAADYELTSDTTELRLPAGAVMGRVVSNGIMPRTGESQLHLLLSFSDQLGSTTFTLDHATSELVEYVTYTAYGQTESDYRTDRWDNHREHTRFTGKEEDIEVGLNYHGARYYSPALKRWMSADPVTIHQAGSDINPWAYGYGNPTSFVDPDGNCPLLVIGVIVVAALVSGATNATVQYAQTGNVNWGWRGVAGAAVAGGVGAAVGMGVGAFAGQVLSLGATASASLGGAAGGASSGALGTRFATGGWEGAGKAALTGAISGAVGGAVGALAGGANPGGLRAFGASMAGTGAGTGAGLGMSAAWGDEITWQSAGIAFASAFGGAIASYGLSKGWSEATEESTGGQAAGEAAGESSHKASRAVSGRLGGVTRSGSMDLPVYPGGPGDPGIGDIKDRTAAELARDEQVRKFYKGRSPVGGTVAGATAKTGQEHAVLGLERTSGKLTFRLGTTAVEKQVNGELLGQVEAVIPAHDPEKWKVSFQAHTHPDQPGGQYMSNADLYVGRSTGAYVYVLPPGGRTMLCFDPVKDTITVLPGVNK